MAVLGGADSGSVLGASAIGCVHGVSVAHAGSPHPSLSPRGEGRVRGGKSVLVRAALVVITVGGGAVVVNRISGKARERRGPFDHSNPASQALRWLPGLCSMLMWRAPYPQRVTRRKKKSPRLPVGSCSSLVPALSNFRSLKASEAFSSIVGVSRWPPRGGGELAV